MEELVALANSKVKSSQLLRFYHALGASLVWSR
jgi:hypothetical protein